MTIHDLIDQGGAYLLLHYYNGSVIRLLQSIYPMYPWDITRFAKVPKHHWENPEHVKHFIQALELKLGIHKPDDWYGITSDTLKRVGGLHLISNVDALQRALQVAYPSVEWRPDQLSFRALKSAAIRDII